MLFSCPIITISVTYRIPPYPAHNTVIPPKSPQRAFSVFRYRHFLANQILSKLVPYHSHGQPSVFTYHPSCNFSNLFRSRLPALLPRWLTILIIRRLHHSSHRRPRSAPSAVHDVVTQAVGRSCKLGLSKQIKRLFISLALSRPSVRATFKKLK